MDVRPEATAEFALRWQALRTRLDAAARRAGRDPAAVRVVAVTKSAPPAVFAAAAALGLQDLGENRVQDAASRLGGWERAFRWHFVGHLQSNKARRAVQLFDAFHGVDSLELLLRLDRLALELGRSPALFVQVNVSGEPGKEGIPPNEAEAVVAAGAALSAARLVGLMTMAPRSADPEDARPVFAGLAALRARLSGRGHVLPHLSMGMSDDAEVAVEEGATLVRVGRALVEGLRLPEVAAVPGVDFRLPQPPPGPFR